MGDIHVLRAIRRPFTNFAKLFLGAILMAIPVFNIFSLGFIYNCIQKPGTLPDWNLRMFLQGIKLLLFIIAYLIPLAVIFGLSYTLEIMSDSIFIIPLTIILIFSLYIIPAAIVSFIKTNKIYKGVFNFAFSKDYLAAFLVGILWIAVLNGLSVLFFSVLHTIFSLSIFFIVSFLISMILSFASQITFVSLLRNAHD